MENTRGSIKKQLFSDVYHSIPDQRYFKRRVESCRFATGAVSNQPFTLEILQVRQFTNSLYYYARFISPDDTTAGYSLFTSQNDGGGVADLNVPGAYTITVQCIAPGIMTFLHVDVTAVLS